MPHHASLWPDEAELLAGDFPASLTKQSINHRITLVVESERWMEKQQVRAAHGPSAPSGWGVATAVLPCRVGQTEGRGAWPQGSKDTVPAFLW